MTLEQALKTNLFFKKTTDKEWADPDFAKQRYYSADDVLSNKWEVKAEKLKQSYDVSIPEGCDEIPIGDKWFGKKVRVTLEEI